MIMIYDYIEATAPAMLKRLKRRFGIRKPRVLAKEKVRIRLWVDDGPFEFWRELMEEPPRPGRREEIA